MIRNHRGAAWQAILATAFAFVTEASAQGSQPPALRPYGEVITAAAKTDDGIFKVHRIGDRLFYEIPTAELDKDFLWVIKLKETTLGAGFGGQPVRSGVVRWVAKGNRVWLLNINYSVGADSSMPIARAVDAANHPTVIFSFNVTARSSAGDPVIDVTPLFMTDVPELSVRGEIGGGSFDPSRSFLEKAVSFPENINVEVTQTFTRGPAPAAGGSPVRRIQGPSGTVLTHHSMVKLPDRPMRPRRFDPRVGYYAQGITDFGTGEQGARQKGYIARWRLEKKDPGAELSEPVKPIVYYIDPATPAKWVPYVRQGIEDWQVAFEAAGFEHAIVARDAPANDPDWSPEDARYSVVRWWPATDQGARGPSVRDPRTGEILEADIEIRHNSLPALMYGYFLTIGPLDPRARTLPLPDELVGRLLRSLVAHEVGHTLGLAHNMKAGSGYTIAQVRDSAWVRQMGHTPTIMDYSRFNYVAQPEDGIAPRDLVMAGVGPYDTWAVMWGYRSIPDELTPDEEKRLLDVWARELDTKPYLRYVAEGDHTDPGNTTGGVGNADPLAATQLGLKNLARVAEMLRAATNLGVGDPQALMERLYEGMVGGWSVRMTAVARMVGGTTHEYTPVGIRLVALPKEKQAEAVQVLLQHAFQAPAVLIQPELLRRMDDESLVDRVRSAQSAVLGELLQSERIDRMVDQVALDGPVAYSPVRFLGDLRSGLWSELNRPEAAIDVYRRNVQRSYLNTIDNLLNGSEAPSGEVRSLLAGELRALDRALETALPGVTDESTKRHLEDSRHQIARILEQGIARIPRAR